MKHQVDTIQEALHIERAAETVLKYVEKGVLDLGMPLGEALEKLAEIQGKLTGEKEDGERDEKE